MSQERNHTDYHLRNIDQQVLDALLRIEEILDRAFPDPRKQVEAVPAEVIDTKPGGITKVRRK